MSPTVPLIKLFAEEIKKRNNQMKGNLKIGFYIAPVFCALLCLMQLFAGDVTAIVFYAHLPLCFMFGAFPATALYKKVLSLEEELKDLKTKLNS